MQSARNGSNSSKKSSKRLKMGPELDKTTTSMFAGMFDEDGQGSGGDEGEAKSQNASKEEAEEVVKAWKKHQVTQLPCFQSSTPVCTGLGIYDTGG